MERVPTFVDETGRVVWDFDAASDGGVFLTLGGGEQYRLSLEEADALGRMLIADVLCRRRLPPRQQLKFEPTEEVASPRRGVNERLFLGPCPEWMAGKPRDGWLPDQYVEIGGDLYRVLAIDRHLPASPYREGEPIGLLVEPDLRATPD